MAKSDLGLVIWNVLILIWIVGGVGGVSDNCAGLSGTDLSACEAGTAIGAGLGVTFIIIIWFLGFIILGLVWLMSRPKENVIVYGPDGQQVTVSEKEAKRRFVEGLELSTAQPHAGLAS